MEIKKVLAVDLGASSGRVMLGSFDGEKISVEELHRFSNDPVILGKTMYWDFLRLFHEINAVTRHRVKHTFLGLAFFIRQVVAKLHTVHCHSPFRLVFPQFPHECEQCFIGIENILFLAVITHHRAKDRKSVV